MTVPAGASLAQTSTVPPPEPPAIPTPPPEIPPPPGPPPVPSPDPPSPVITDPLPPGQGDPVREPVAPSPPQAA